MQGLHRLLNRHGLVEAVDLKEVNVVRAESFETGFDGVEDCGAAEAALVDVVFALLDRVGKLDVHHSGLFADGSKALRQYNKFLARDLVLFDGVADHLFRNAVGVDVGGVPGVEATIVSSFEEFVDLLRVINHPWLPVLVAC